MNRVEESLAYRVVARFFEHDGFGIAAEGAFRFLLSFVPSCIFMIALTTVVGLSEESLAYVVGFLTAALPAGSQAVLGETISAALSNPLPGLLTSSLIVTLWTASGVLGTFTKALNRAFGLRTTTKTFFRNLGVSMLLVPMIAIPVAVAGVLIVFGNAIVSSMVARGVAPFLGSALGVATRWVVTLGLVILLLALLYQVAPARKMRFVEMLPGAALATALWVLLSALFREFVSSGFARYRIYGGLTAVVIFMFWTYLSAIAFIVGAEFNAELIARRESASPAPPQPVLPRDEPV